MPMNVALANGWAQLLLIPTLKKTKCVQRCLWDAHLIPSIHTFLMFFFVFIHSYYTILLLSAAHPFTVVDTHINAHIKRPKHFQFRLFHSLSITSSRSLCMYFFRIHIHINIHSVLYIVCAQCTHVYFCWAKHICIIKTQIDWQKSIMSLLLSWEALSFSQEIHCAMCFFLLIVKRGKGGRKAVWDANGALSSTPRNQIIAVSHFIIHIKCLLAKILYSIPHCVHVHIFTITYRYVKQPINLANNAWKSVCTLKLFCLCIFIRKCKLLTQVERQYSIAR